MAVPSEPPAWVDEIDTTPGPPFLRMGTRALGGSPGGGRGGAWLLDGPDVPGQLAAKRRILARHHAEAVVTTAAADPAATELLAVVTSTVVSPPPGDPGAHPLDVAGRAVAEDLCLLVRGDRGWVLAAGTVCFPSHWRLADKVGRPMAAVHGPVPRYDVELAARVDQFLDRLRIDRPVWRRNWMVHHSPDLFVPAAPPSPDPPVTGDDAGDRLWLRSERQTLRRLPDSGSIVFGIRTQQLPLGLVGRRPDVCARLAEAAAGWPDDLVAYRGGEALRRPLVAWLAAAAGG